MGVIIELATAEDADELANVVIGGTADAYAGLLSQSYLDSLPQLGLNASYRRSIDRGDEYWIARLAGAVVGMARATSPRSFNPPRPLELTMIYVYSDHRGTGIAQSLLDHAIGDQPCLLWVGESNLRAQAFYRRNGFEPDGTSQSVATLEGLVGLRFVR